MTTSSTKDNPYVRRARVGKAITLESWLREHQPGVSESELREWSPAQRAQVALHAHTGRPSAETWHLVCLLIAGKQLPEEYR